MESFAIAPEPIGNCRFGQRAGAFKTGTLERVLLSEFCLQLPLKDGYHFSRNPSPLIQFNPNHQP